MPNHVRLEVCVDSVASAVAAEQGGAHRVELCSDLPEGGVTPSAGLIAMVRKRVAIGLQVLIRPRAGDFCYSADEFEVMTRDILLAKQLGVNGVVFGVLDAEGNVDTTRTRELVVLARPLDVTFHRAFDMTRDLNVALEEVLKAGAHRILTSGAARTAEDGTEMIARLVKTAAGRLEIMAGGGIREENVQRIVEESGVRELHASLLSPVPSPMRFRNEKPVMGALRSKEYERFEVLPETVAGILQAVSKAHLPSMPDR